MLDVSAHEATQTYLCKTVDCDGIARSGNGRESYCVACQVARGTRRADGSLPGFGGKTASSRPRKPAAAEPGAYERPALELVDAARELDRALETYRQAKPALEAAVAAYKTAAGKVAAVNRGPLRESADAEESSRLDETAARDAPGPVLRAAEHPA